MSAVFHRYWDASALVKVVAKDQDEAPGQAKVQEVFHRGANQRATAYCLAEALSAFKAKWLRKKISRAEYLDDVREFFRLVVPRLTQVDVPFAGPVRSEAERIMQRHELDFIDAIQLATVLYGRESIFVGGSQTLFVTADRELARAAESEGARVWECTKPLPSGVTEDD